MGSDQENRIKCIEKGWGQDSIFFTTRKEATCFKVDEIKEEVKKIGNGEYCELTHSVYRGYVNGQVKFEMGVNSDVTVTYY